MMRNVMLFSMALLTGFPAFVISGQQAREEDARQILQHALKAAGGRFNALRGPMMWMERGAYYGEGAEGSPFIAQYASKWPDWFRCEIEGVFTLTVSGHKAWMINDAGTQKFAGDELANVMRQVRMAWASFLFPLTGKEYTLKKIDGIRIEGRAVVGIRAIHADGGDFRLYFDKASLLLVKMEANVIIPQFGPSPVLVEAYYSKHKSLGGARLPFKIKVFCDKKLFVTTEIVASKTGATLDPAYFEEPE